MDPDAALSLCCDILLCREEFSTEYVFLHRLYNNDKASKHVSRFFKHDVSFQKYTNELASWVNHKTSVDVLDVLKRRKLNHEEQDWTTKLLIEIGRRVSVRHNVHRRVFCATMCLMNSKDFATYVDAETKHESNIRGSRFIKLAHEFTGDVFTTSFDKRSHYLSPEKKLHRKHARLQSIMSCEQPDTMTLQAPWRKTTCIKRSIRYGALLGKNTVALLTLLLDDLPPGATVKEAGCVPGPGAKSGLSFLQGNSLGMSGGSTCQGVLSDEFDAAVKSYKQLRRRLLGIAQGYRAKAETASLETESTFWLRLAARVEQWRNSDDLRIQFRLCECSKIGGIVLRNVGRWRDSACIIGASEKVGEEEDNGEESVDEVRSAPFDEMLKQFEKFEDSLEPTDDSNKRRRQQ